MHEPLPHGQHSEPKPSQFRIHSHRQPPGAADQMRQTGLARMDPLIIHPLAVTHQKARKCLTKASKATWLRLACSLNKTTVELTIPHSQANTPC
jgi:hypothetical protein